MNIDIAEYLRLHGLWLCGEDGGARADLTDADLTGADLTGADLTDAVLRDADLTDAVLRDAVLRGAVLRGADLTDADLTDADLTDAVLRDAVLRDAVLRGAVLRGADLTDADLTDADLTDAVLRDAVLRDAVLTGADLTGADLTDAVLRGADLTNGLQEMLRVPQLHMQILSALESGGRLEMSSWHSCQTTHCRAGWNVTLAGDAGRMAEALLGPAVAGALIAIASCPYLERVPDFYGSNEDALADIRRCAGIEATATTAPNAVEGAQS